MSIPQPALSLKQQLEQLVGQLDGWIEGVARFGRPIHEVEGGIFEQVMQLGRQCLSHFLALQGDGDRGPTVESGDGQIWQRLPEPHPRRYVSVFGEFQLSRVVYGSREGQKIAFVPLDNRLQLPESAYSYLLQNWSQGLCVESAFGPVTKTLQRILGLKISVDALERMNEHMARRVEAYRDDRPVPSAETEGAILVASADGKGVVMRRSASDPAPSAHRTKGEKASQKRMATVASVYAVDPHVRTAEDVVAALFHDPREGPAPDRPRPQNKHVWAHLPRCVAGEEATSGIDLAFAAIEDELFARNRRDGLWLRPMVCIQDGQEALWEARDRHLPRGAVDILDLLHVTPRLWQAAHLFHREGSDAAKAFVRERCLRVLQGGVGGVIRGLREMATKRGLTGAKKKTLGKVCGYLEKNRERMRYDEYLKAGYPIASGVIEGACRHLVKDRMERAGMHWTPQGAQAMLDVRSVHVDGEWENFQHYRITQETEKLYPYRYLVDGLQYQLAC